MAVTDSTAASSLSTCYESSKPLFSLEKVSKTLLPLSPNLEHYLSLARQEAQFLSKDDYLKLNKIISELKVQSALDEPRHGGISPLQWAQKLGRIECVELFLSCRVGYPVNSAEKVDLIFNRGKTEIEIVEDQPDSWATHPIVPYHRSDNKYYHINGLDTLPSNEMLQLENDALIDLYKLPKQHLPKILLTWSENSSTQVSIYDVKTPSSTPTNVHCVPLDLKGDYEVMWIHVTDTIGLVILPIARAIARNISAKSNETIAQAPIINLFLRSFRLSPIPSKDNLIQYRDNYYDRKILSHNLSQLEINTIDTTTIVFPYLVVEKGKSWTGRREKNKGINKHFTRDRHDAYFFGAYSVRTLDETCYPGLDAKAHTERNKDQIIDIQYKRELKDEKAHKQRNKDQIIDKQHLRELEDEEENPPDKYSRESEDKKKKPPPEIILLVPQLWLWKVDNVLVTACSTTRPSGIFANHPQCPDKLYPRLCTERSIELQMAIILENYIFQFGKSYEDKNGKTIKSTLSLFNTSLVTLSSDVREYLEDEDSDPDKEQDFIHSISDIREELSIILTIISQQKEVLNTFHKDMKRQRKAEEAEHDEKNLKYEDDHDLGAVLDVLQRGIENLDQHKKRIEELKQSAERISKSIDDWLNLIRVGATIQEAKIGVSLASYAVAFAVVTIIFTPLSFVASLVSLPIKHFVEQKDRYSNSPEGDTMVYNSRYIIDIFLVVEFTSLLVVGVVTLALRIYSKKLPNPEPIKRMINLMKEPKGVIWKRVKAKVNGKVKSAIKRIQNPIRKGSESGAKVASSV